MAMSSFMWVLEIDVNSGHIFLLLQKVFLFIKPPLLVLTLLCYFSHPYITIYPPLLAISTQVYLEDLFKELILI